uniref:Uncharacterized protein n=1 Tax=Anopheles atroparvus TaxID=41427 RepID=A0AAG5DFB9_ANOAO
MKKDPSSHLPFPVGTTARRVVRCNARMFPAVDSMMNPRITIRLAPVTTGAMRQMLQPHP